MADASRQRATRADAAFNFAHTRNAGCSWMSVLVTNALELWRTLPEPVSESRGVEEAMDR
jgi:hypothetical protein